MARIIHGVIFDLDGTLTQPGAIDFGAMRTRSGAPPGQDVLAYASSHPDPAERARIHAVLEEEEEAGFARARLMPDADALLGALEACALRLAVVTRNNERVMARTVALLQRPAAFSLLLSRTFSPTKPHPAPVLHVARTWGCEAADVVVVGDSADDMLAGRAAGARTLLVGAPGHPAFAAALPHADAAVATLTDAAAVLRSWDPRLLPLEGVAAAATAGAETER